MCLRDLYEELKTVLLPQTRQPDFDEFWERMLARSKEQPLNPALEPLEYAVPDVRVQRISYAAYDGGTIAGWSVTPAQVKPRPTLIFFHGYSGHRGPIANYLMWALQGFTCLTFDVRGQGGESRR